MQFSLLYPRIHEFSGSGLEGIGLAWGAAGSVGWRGFHMGKCGRVAFQLKDLLLESPCKAKPS